MGTSERVAADRVVYASEEGERERERLRKKGGKGGRMSSSERTVSSLSASSSPMHERKKGVVPSSASLQQKEDLLRKKKAKRTLGGVAAFDDDGMPMQALPPAKQKRNPLVLVGAVVTAGVLGCGLVSFYQGNQVLAQSMMRYRVLAQGATVAIMVTSTAAASTSTSPSSSDGPTHVPELSLEKMLPKTIRNMLFSATATAAPQHNTHKTNT